MLGKRERPPFKRTTSMSGIYVAAEEIPPPFEPQNPTIGGGGFGDIIVGPSGYDEGSMAMMPPGFHMTAGSGNSATVEMADFLRTCGLCNRSLPPGRDIYMYRGDAAFCSLECREQQIKQDEKKEQKERRAMAKKAETHHNHSNVAATAASDTSSKSETVGAA